MNNPLKIPYGMSLFVYVDGASRGNPGNASLSVLFEDDVGNEYFKHSEFLGIMTNNQAEMSAVKFALNMAIQYTRGVVKIFSDSLNSVRWLDGSWCLRSPNIRPIFDDIQKLRLNFGRTEFFHYPRTNPKIQICDRMCNDCLNVVEGKNGTTTI